jgi:hypothetical protein
LKPDEPPAVMPSRNTLPAQLERCGSDRFLRRLAVGPPAVDQNTHEKEITHSRISHELNSRASALILYQSIDNSIRFDVRPSP